MMIRNIDLGSMNDGHLERRNIKEEKKKIKLSRPSPHIPLTYPLRGAVARSTQRVAGL
jgi:hypothetical protein